MFLKIIKAHVLVIRNAKSEEQLFPRKPKHAKLRRGAESSGGLSKIQSRILLVYCYWPETTLQNALSQYYFPFQTMLNRQMRSFTF